MRSLVWLLPALLAAPAAAAPPVEPAAVAPSETLSLKVRDGEVRDTLSLLGRVAGMNVIADASVGGRISLNLDKVTFAAALDALALTAGLAVTRTEGNVYIVSKPPASGLSPLVGRSGPTGGDPKDRPVNFNVKNAELASVIENIANQAGAQLLVKGALSDRVSGRLAGARFEDALRRLLAGTRYGFVREGDAYLIGDATPGTPTSRALEETESFALAYTAAKSVSKLIPASLTQYVKIDEARNAVVVSGTELLRNQVKKLLSRIDAPLKQVVFEVKIIELTDTGSRDLNALKLVQNGSTVSADAEGGTALSAAGQLADSSALGVLNGVARVLEVVSGLVSEGKGRLLTDTKLSTVSGQKAALDVQTDINLTLTTQSTVNGSTTNTTTINTLRAGTVVELEPTVQADGNVLAVLNLESSVAGSRANTNTAPDISRRKVRNTLLLKNNQTIEIGGLIQTNNTENITRIPIVGYLPLIGQLFSNTSVSVDQRELLVFLTPRIRDVQPLPDAQLPLGPAR
ncbi:MAG: hypothetical protein KME03_01755 [Aphanocapsa lilacina HA4352-LM1]|jgi:type IV pilus assembly protein PilQ|nr:hypothetical protein [Aphanocapsa lilacina HA4352-LM1]